MITPLQIDQLTRDTVTEFDPVAIAQILPLAYDACYKPRLYKAPDSAEETIPAGGYTSYGLNISPGSLIYGFYNDPNDPVVVQVTDTSLEMAMFSEPVPVGLIANGQKTTGYPYLLCGPYPVVGTGLFMVEIWNNSEEDARVQIVFGVLEALDNQTTPTPLPQPLPQTMFIPGSPAQSTPAPASPAQNFPVSIPPATGTGPRPSYQPGPQKAFGGYPGTTGLSGLRRK